MLGALVLSLVVAQAEPAPPEPRPIPQAVPRPSPSGYVPPADDAEPSAGAVGLLGRVAYRVGAAGRQLAPRVGYSLGIDFQRRYVTLWNRIELGVVGDFFHDRFSRGVQGSAMTSPGVEVTYDSLRLISQTSFAVLQAVGLRGGRLRGWIGGGGGLTIGYFSTGELELRPGEANAYQPLLRAAVECAVGFARNTDLIFRADYSWVLTSHRFTPRGGESIAVFGDLANVGVGLGYRF